MLSYVQELSRSDVTYRATPTLSGSGSSATLSGMNDIASGGGEGATARAIDRFFPFFRSVPKSFFRSLSFLDLFDTLS